MHTALHDGMSDTEEFGDAASSSSAFQARESLLRTYRREFEHFTTPHLSGSPHRRRRAEPTSATSAWLAMRDEELRTRAN
jgi:hypothetical protein